MITLLLIVLGFVAGLIGALAGLGGGISITPILALHFGVTSGCIGSSLVAVNTASVASSAVHLQRHTTDIRLGMTLELATAMGAAITAYFAGYVNRGALRFFAAFLLYAAISLLRVRAVMKGRRLSDLRRFRLHTQKLSIGFPRGRWALRALGDGGEPIKVPVMYLFMEVPLIMATATFRFYDQDHCGFQRFCSTPGTFSRPSLRP